MKNIDCSQMTEHLVQEYVKALESDFVRKPISYALYQTWKWADKNEKERKNE